MSTLYPCDLLGFAGANNCDNRPSRMSLGREGGSVTVVLEILMEPEEKVGCGGVVA